MHTAFDVILMAEYSTLAAVDLGSNSFHCQVARVVGEQIYPLDSLREPVRLGAGLGDDKMLDAASQERSLAACTASANGCAASTAARCAPSAPTRCGSQRMPPRF